jgi:DNA-binding transcriptional LysR family regulator
MSDRLQQLAVFVRVAESGSFSRAARDLGLSQPSISRSVGELEARLGVRLLLRTTRRLILTDAGAAFLERSRQLLADSGFGARRLAELPRFVVAAPAYRAERPAPRSPASSAATT